jgi:hypothetical protein
VANVATLVARTTGQHHLESTTLSVPDPMPMPSSAQARTPQPRTSSSTPHPAHQNASDLARREIPESNWCGIAGSAERDGGEASTIRGVWIGDCRGHSRQGSHSYVHFTSQSKLRASQRWSTENLWRNNARCSQPTWKKRLSTPPKKSGTMKIKAAHNTET